MSDILEIYNKTTGLWEEYPVLQGKSAYQSYLDTTTDIIKLTEKEWVESLRVTGTGIPPNNISSFSVLVDDGKATLKWSDPPNTIVDGQLLSTWAGTKLVRKVGSYPVDEQDGTLVVDNRVKDAYSITGFTDTGLVNGTTYYYQLFPYSDSNAVNKNTSNRISAIPILYRIMTVNIDLSNSNPATCCSYNDDAVFMIAGSSEWDTFFDYKPCLFKDGSVVCYLNPNDFTKDINGNTIDITSGNAGDVMIEFPRRGLTISTAGNIVTVKMTDNPNNPAFEYNAHRRGTTQKDKFYLGAYKGYSLSSKLRSLSGKSITSAQTIGAFRTLAQANGTGYDQSGFYQIIFRQCMYLLKYKNLDSQTSVGRGYADGNSAILTTGGTNAKGMTFGETTGKLQMKLFGIEDTWGNIWEWTDGVATDSSGIILTATNGFNNSLTSYNSQGQGIISDMGSYISKPLGTTNVGFILKEVNGSATSYFCDGGALSLSSFAIFGGYYADTSAGGVFHLNITYSASFTSVNVGARLMYL